MADGSNEVGKGYEDPVRDATFGCQPSHHIASEEPRGGEVTYPL